MKNFLLLLVPIYYCDCIYINLNYNYCNAILDYAVLVKKH